jgi:hypothetical protein
MYGGYVLSEHFTRSKSVTQNVAQQSMHAASIQLDCAQETVTGSCIIFNQGNLVNNLDTRKFFPLFDAL